MQEVRSNLPVFLATAERVLAQLEMVQFVIASFNEAQAEMARSLARDYPDLPVSIVVGKTAEAIQASSCCLACSGSVSLELLYHEKPSVIHYRIGWLADQLQRRFRNAKYITLVNLLATEEITRSPHDPPYDPNEDAPNSVPFPEYLTCTDQSQQMARWLVRWVKGGPSRSRVCTELARLKEQHARPGASQRAATFIRATVQEARHSSSLHTAPHLSRTRASHHVLD